MRKLLSIVGIFCMALAMQACGDTSLFPFDPIGPGDPKDPGNGGGNTVKLTETKWQLKSFEVVNGDVTEVLPGQLYTISFMKDGSVSGTAYCNGFMGQYTAGASNSISITGFVVTDMFCGDDSREGEYMDALLASTSYSIDENSLRIYYENGTKVLNYGPAGETPIDPVDPGPSVTIDDILGKEWRLLTIESTDDLTLTKNVTVVPNDQLFTIKFDENNPGKLVGMANCNVYAAGFEEQNGIELRVHSLASTKKGCGISGSLDTEYFDLLLKSQNYVAFLGPNGGLTINCDGGKGTLFFIAQQ